MRAVIQRVNHASVEIEKKIKVSISKGLLIFAGIEEADDIEDIKRIRREPTRPLRDVIHDLGLDGSI